jgi:hypothetical protein
MLYCVTLYKQMDMLFFPLNHMFSQSNAAIEPTTYAIKVNNNPIKITNKLYWKKDFSENTLAQYAQWVSNGHTNFMSQYLFQKISDSNKRSHFLKLLTPDISVKESWPKWYIQFNNNKCVKADSISIWKYTFIGAKNSFLLHDSILIYKFLVNE